MANKSKQKSGIIRKIKQQYSPGGVEVALSGSVVHSGGTLEAVNVVPHFPAPTKVQWRNPGQVHRSLAH